ncbi:response regulator transcription factor [Opitutus sp. ER46]|uniref:response regulator n=1 Tax=Opitutus sp. ER46 TaxID=2161864 RepID=UPI000D309515|nr:response regulator transcription factor [Opitutus sp. ER46]PTX91001.1 DNA-binding response regulator [Opitutus sp. ER46]
MNPITVAIVEDNAAFCASLEQIINASASCRCVCASRNAGDGLRAIARHRPQVVVMDINLPDLTGIECTARLKRQQPELQILILTVYNDARQIFRALEAGASGYLLKRSTPEEIVRAIVDVQAGGAPMSAEIARKVVQSFQQPAARAEEIAALTPRESEILQLLAEGHASKEIADEIGVSYTTVCTHLGNIYGKLQVRSRTAAVAKYLQSDKRTSGV